MALRILASVARKSDALRMGTARSVTLMAKTPITPGITHSVTEINDSDRAVIGSPLFTEEMKKSWQQSDIDINDKHLKIQGHPVMEAWEHPYMKRLAEIATSKGGNVLELGFGMSISATYCQQVGTKMQSHHIIEANNQVAARADKWAVDARTQVVIHRGFSWDVAPSLADGFFDGILYDTYPLEAGKVAKHQIDFFADAHRLLKPGGVFTYFCNEHEDVAEDEKKLLRDQGFEVTTEKVAVPTPDDCEYWRHKHLVAPICIKK